MLDIKFVRENAELLKDVAAKKNLDPAVIDRLLEVDKARRERIQASETLRARQKATKDRDEAKKLKEQFKSEEEELKKIERQFEALAVLVPNPVSPDTPVGKSGDDNREIFRWGELEKI